MRTKTPQNITTQGTTHRTTQLKQAFLVRKEMVRSEVRSKTGYIFLVDRSAVDSLVDRKKTPQDLLRSDVRSKMMVNSLLVTSEVNSKKALFIIDRL